MIASPWRPIFTPHLTADERSLSVWAAAAAGFRAYAQRGKFGGGGGAGDKQTPKEGKGANVLGRKKEVSDNRE